MKLQVDPFCCLPSVITWQPIPEIRDRTFTRYTKGIQWHTTMQPGYKGPNDNAKPLCVQTGAASTPWSLRPFTHEDPKLHSSSEEILFPPLLRQIIFFCLIIFDLNSSFLPHHQTLHSLSQRSSRVIFLIHGSPCFLWNSFPGGWVETCDTLAYWHMPNIPSADIEFITYVMPVSS